MLVALLHIQCLYWQHAGCSFVKAIGAQVMIILLALVVNMKVAVYCKQYPQLCHHAICCISIWKGLLFYIIYWFCILCWYPPVTYTLLYLQTARIQLIFGKPKQYVLTTYFYLLNTVPLKYNFTHEYTFMHGIMYVFAWKIICRGNQNLHVTRLVTTRGITCAHTCLVVLHDRHVWLCKSTHGCVNPLELIDE